MAADGSGEQQTTYGSLMQALNNLSPEELRNLLNAVGADGPARVQKVIATAAAQNLSAADKKDIATVATPDLPVADKKDVANCNVQTLPPEQKQQVQKAAGDPSQKVTDQTCPCSVLYRCGWAPGQM